MKKMSNLIIIGISDKSKPRDFQGPNNANYIRDLIPAINKQ